MGLIEDLAVTMGVPTWFIGGILGYIVMVVTMAFFIRFLKARGVFLTTLIIGLMILNFFVFAWPLWPVIVMGTVLVWQIGIPTLTLRLANGRLRG